MTTPRDRVNHRFAVELGLVNRYVVHELHKAAMYYDVALTELHNDRGWLSRQYIFQVSGQKPNVRSYLDAINRYFKEIDADTEA